MKKLFALLLALMMVFALVACDQGDTPGNTDNPGVSQNGDNGGNSSDTAALESFLNVYGFTVNDVTPKHLVTFEDLKLEGDVDPGVVKSKGFIKIQVDKDATTLDDVKAWFKTLCDKMTALSKDGKLYSDSLLDTEKTFESISAGSLWAEFPEGQFYYTYDLPNGTTVLNVNCSYRFETGVYEMSIVVKKLQS